MSLTIVTGTDGTPPARAAVQRAAELAGALGGKLVVVTAYDKLEVATLNEGRDEYRFASDEEALAIAETAAGQVRRADLDVEATAAQGKPAEVLIGTAEKVGASIVVVGNKRVQGMGRLLGSIASAVAAKADCDVYIVHTHQAR